LHLRVQDGALDTERCAPPLFAVQIEFRLDAVAFLRYFVT
jgi:hypothetical protein